MHYRITKYDPRKRNNEGHYLDNSEWTSIYDIGKPEFGNISYDKYETTETAYIEAIKLILGEKNIDVLMIHSLNIYNKEDDFITLRSNGQLRNIDVDFTTDIANLANGTLLTISEISKVIRLILRETIWMNLLYDKIKITFGYDYYMYVECSELKTQTVDKIEVLGLFVEPHVEQRTIIVVDKNGNEI